MSAQNPRYAAALALALLPACAEEFTEPWEVTEPRLMGARVEVEGARERTRPRLDERFALRQYIALPPRFESPLATRYSMDVAVCLGLRTSGGTLACIGEQELDPVLTPVGETEVLLGGLAFDLSKVQLPGGLPELPGGVNLGDLGQLADLDRLVLFGALCVDGRTERVAGRAARDYPPSQLFRCVDNPGAAFPDPNPFTISILLDRGRPLDANRTPLFACDPSQPESVCNLGVEREGEPRVAGAFVIARPKVAGKAGREVLAWAPRDPALPLPWTGCKDDPTLPQIPAGSEEHTLRVRFDPSDREQYQSEIDRNGQKVIASGREAMLLTHALTEHGGTLTRFESRLDPKDPDGEAEISFGYRPPKQRQDPKENIPKDGRLVRFYFTLRDGRGGVDFATRELCLVEPAQQG